MKATSFVCEHSAEFVLIPFLTKLFSAHKQILVPLYFWKSREGSLISKRCNNHTPIRLFAMYARRPKIFDPDQDYIFIKINNILFKRSYYLRKNGIPTIIGVPRVSSIMNFHIGCPCTWFYLYPDENFKSDFELTIDIKSNICNDKLPLSIQGPLNDEELLNIYSKCTLLSSWQDAIQILRGETFYYGAYEGSFYWSMGTYKPVYFMIR